MTELTLAQKRAAMVRTQLENRGITNPAVLHAFRTIPRHIFVENYLQERAYADHPLPIACEQTISQPYMVGIMIELLELNLEDRVLEIGSGSGYQTAILSLLADEIHAVERHRQLVESARDAIEQLGFSNITFHCCDGTRGLPFEAPFNAIVVAAGAPVTPKSLLDQLALGGRLVIPVGSQTHQVLKRYIRKEDGYIEEDHGGCRFVKFIGKYGWPEP